MRNYFKFNSVGNLLDNSNSEFDILIEIIIIMIWIKILKKYRKTFHMILSSFMNVFGYKMGMLKVQNKFDF